MKIQLNKKKSLDIVANSPIRLPECIEKEPTRLRSQERNKINRLIELELELVPLNCGRKNPITLQLEF